MVIQSFNKKMAANVPRFCNIVTGWSGMLHQMFMRSGRRGIRRFHISGLLDAKLQRKFVKDRVRDSEMRGAGRGERERQKITPVLPGNQVLLEGSEASVGFVL